MIIIAKPRRRAAALPAGTRAHTAQPKPPTDTHTTPILIDDRAGSQDLINYPPLDTLGTLCRLDSADVMIAGNGPNDNPTLIGIEVKSLSDLLSSADSGRLQATQIPAMLSTYTVNYVAYYGAYKSGPDGELLIPFSSRNDGTRWRAATLGGGNRLIPYGYLHSLLLTLSAVGIRIHHTQSIDEMAVWLGCLHRWWSKPWISHTGMHTFDSSCGRIQGGTSLLPTHSPHTAQIAEVLSRLPGIGYTRAVAAGEHFESIEDAFMAGADEWMKVPGIGKTIAESTVRTIRARRVQTKRVR